MGAWVCTFIDPNAPKPEDGPPAPPCDEMVREIRYNVNLECHQLPKTIRDKMKECGFAECEDGKDFDTGNNKEPKVDWLALLLKVGQMIAEGAMR